MLWSASTSKLLALYHYFGTLVTFPWIQISIREEIRRQTYLIRKRQLHSWGLKISAFVHCVNQINKIENYKGIIFLSHTKKRKDLKPYKMHRVRNHWYSRRKIIPSSIEKWISHVETSTIYLLGSKRGNFKFLDINVLQVYF